MPGARASKAAVSLRFTLDQFGPGIGTLDDARRRRPGGRRTRSRSWPGCRSSTARPPGRRRSPPVRRSCPRGSGSSREMSARARSRGTPPTAGVGWRAATSSRAVGTEPSGRRARVPATVVPRWVMLCRWTRSGRSGTSSVGAQGSQGWRRWPRPPGGARHCPWWTPGVRGAGRCSTRRIRSVVPASGRLRTRPPARSTRSSGLAPTSWPPGVGMEKTEHVGSSRCQRRSRSATSMGSPIRTSTWRATTTLATSSFSTARTASATMASNDASDVCGTMVGPVPADPRIRRDGVGFPGRCAHEPGPQSVRSGREFTPVRSHHGHPLGPGGLGTVDDLRHHQAPRAGPVEGQGSEGDHPGGGRVEPVVAHHGGQGTGEVRPRRHVLSRPWGSATVSARPSPTSSRSAVRNTMPVDPARANGSMGGPGSRGSRTATMGPVSAVTGVRPGWR